jgi:HEAT repeat protein
VPASSSELQVTIALAVSAAALASAVLLLVTIASLRAARRWRHWRLASHEGTWHEALHVATENPDAAPLPPIARIDLPEFLVLWNHLQESLRGAASDNLSQLLRRQGVDRRALALLRSPSVRLRLIAITTLGHLRDDRAWGRLIAIAQERGAVMSFAAARALLRINPRQALEILGPSIVARDDWPVARIATILHELGPAVVTPALMGLMLARPRGGLERLARLARFGYREKIAPIVRGWLSESQDASVVAAALDYVEDAEDVPWARAAARHGDWRVRVAAARALGRVGDRRQLAALLDLLRDPVWWVRYHAAQSLVRLHGLTPSELESMRDGARDAYAADMLGQALAERGRR